jgi:para-aminobenzoate synthetase
MMMNYGMASNSIMPKIHYRIVNSKLQQESEVLDNEIPDFIGGSVGYFGYEMKCESMASNPNSQDYFKIKSAETTPDSAFIFADRVIAFDHQNRHIYLFALDFNPFTSSPVEWLKKTADSISYLASHPTPYPSPDMSAKEFPPVKHTLSLQHSSNVYKQNISKSLSKIKDGETYEVCLTSKITLSLPPQPSSSHDTIEDITSANTTCDSKTQPPFAIYKHLRNRNPAPYGAYINFGDGLVILGSSPERFLKCDANGWVEMRPIKGTAARPFGIHGLGLTEYERDLEDYNRKVELESSEKNRAENLMV